MSKTRREFIGTTTSYAGLAMARSLWPGSAIKAQDANSRLTVAAIGVGGSRGRYNRGGEIGMQASKLGQMIAVCDVDDVHNVEFNGRFENKLNTYQDYRELFEKESPDIVTIGTPDHWHVPISKAALRAGCDVYCEKPLTLTIQEGIELQRVVAETGRVFQVGTQQRSEYDLVFLKAIAIVQSGRLGKNVKAYVAIGAGPSDGPFQSSLPPDDLDWDMWVGPAPAVEYCPQRHHQFRWFHEYSGGKMTDWGAHHVDIAQWAFGCEHTGPVKISARGKFPAIVPDDFNWVAFLSGKATLPNAFNSATEFSIDLEFANGSAINVKHHYRNEDGSVDFGNGLLFEGDEGRIFVTRGALRGKPVEKLTEQDNQELADRVDKLYQGRTPGNHMQNFFECVQEREQPISDVVTHHRTMTSLHLCNLSLWLGRDLQWDPDRELVVGDEQANLLRSRPSREGFG